MPPIVVYYIYKVQLDMQEIALYIVAYVRPPSPPAARRKGIHLRPPVRELAGPGKGWKTPQSSRLQPGSSRQTRHGQRPEVGQRVPQDCRRRDDRRDGDLLPGGRGLRPHLCVGPYVEEHRILRSAPGSRNRRWRRIPRHGTGAADGDQPDLRPLQQTGPARLDGGCPRPGVRGEEAGVPPLPSGDGPAARREEEGRAAGWEAPPGIFRLLLRGHGLL